MVHCQCHVILDFITFITFGESIPLAVRSTVWVCSSLMGSRVQVPLKASVFVRVW